MKHRRKNYICAVLAILTLLPICGCEAMLEREFPYEKPHVTAAAPSEGDQSSIRVADMQEMKDLLMQAVASAEPALKVRIAAQSDAMDTWVSELLKSLTKKEPLFVYAVYSILPKLNRFVSEYEVEFTITYRVSPQDIHSIEPVSGPEQLKAILAETIEAVRQKIIITVSDYSADTYDFDSLYAEAIESMPNYAFGLGWLKQSSHPPTGRERIIELEIEHTLPLYEINSAIKSAQSAVEGIMQNAPKNRDDAILYFHDYLCESVTPSLAVPVSKLLSKPPGYDVPYSVYGALVEGSAVGLGYALAFKQLCIEAGIECMLVGGMLGETPHVWNLVQTSDGWFHVDAAGDALIKPDPEAGDESQEPPREFFLKDDAEISATHTIETEGLPESERIPAQE